jgi:hypothetical protein
MRSGESYVNYEGLYYFMRMLSLKMRNFYYYEDIDDAWSDFNYLNEFSSMLTKALYQYDYDGLKNYYFNMGIKPSEDYIKHFDEFNDFMWELGYGVSEAHFDADDGLGTIYRKGLPCENDYYNELKKTGDYWWFLICVMQKFSSPCDEDYTPGMEEISEDIMEHYQSFTNGFSFDWFFPLKHYLHAKKLENEFSRKSLKSFSSYYSNVDFSNIKEADISEVPEYEVEEIFINHGNKYYNKMDVFLAITAAGGVAQALERQDLEDKITTVGRLRKKNKIGRH